MFISRKTIQSLKERLGPGIITGAADDDPSGVMTCLLVGAQTGLSLIWTTIITIPFMITVQEMCARIGLVTKHGLAGNMRRRFSPLILFPTALLMLFANTMNIAADLSGMIVSSQLLLPLPKIVIGSAYTALILFVMVRFSYQTLARIFRWLTLPILAYIAAALLSDLSLRDLLFHTLVPQIELNRTLILGIVAILGTTVSPYLFFWQASEEVEEKRLKQKITRTLTVTKNEIKTMRQDVAFGMVASNIVMFFIMATGAAVFHSRGVNDIATTAEAALALTPLTGKFASLLFTLGIIGTGMLAIPVLAGSAAYLVAESFGWQEGLDRQFYQAKSFYFVIIAATILGLVFSLLPFDPIRLLFYTAVVYGLISPIMIALVMYLANHRQLMGDKANGPISNLFGGLTFLAMTLSAAALLFVR